MNLWCKGECKWQRPLQQPSLLLGVFEDRYMEIPEMSRFRGQFGETLTCEREVKTELILRVLIMVLMWSV